MTVTTVDRRTRTKARLRSAILDATRDLIAERGGMSFTIDELADRADVARRTVFRHFTGIDDVVLSVCEDAMAVIADDFLTGVADVPVGDGSPSAMFDELAAALRAPDVPFAIVTVMQLLTSAGSSRARTSDLSEAVYARVAERLVVEVGRRNPGVDPLDAKLLVTSLIHGIGVIAEQWLSYTGSRPDADSLAEWARLLERLLARTRSGYVQT